MAICYAHFFAHPGGRLAGSSRLAARSRRCSQSPPADGAPSEQQLARLIEQLDADTFDVRERATRELHAIGLPALPALEAARTHTSAEVRGRVKVLIESLTTGVRRREFQEFAMTPDESLDVEHGMWLIARIVDPKASKQQMQRQLDALAARVRERLDKGDEPASADPQKLVAALRDVLFVDGGFTGNVQDYRNPDNSSLPRVLETKKGLPILLSHLTVAVARRLKRRVVGVPLSGVYIVKYDGSRAPAGFPRDDIFLHPFESGRVIPAADLDKEFPGQSPAEVAPDHTRQTLTRMLANLTSALAAREEHGKLEQVQELKGLLEANEPPNADR